MPLLRRDLFDARFQLYSRDEDAPSSSAGPELDDGEKDGKQGEDNDGEEYVDSTTDLVPGLYEGGLKTWEGGVDLVEVLNGVEGVGAWVKGSKVLEVCLQLPPIRSSRYIAVDVDKEADIRSDAELLFPPRSCSLLYFHHHRLATLPRRQERYSIYKTTINPSYLSSPCPIFSLLFCRIFRPRF